MNRSQWIMIAALSGALFGLDRWTKYFFMHTDLAMRDASWFGGAIGIVFHKNEGLIANVPVPLFLIILASFFAIGWIAKTGWHDFHAGFFSRSAAFILLFFGALGNLFDRLVYGFVFDWLLLFGRSVINIADLMIAVGLIVYFILRRKELLSLR